MPTLHLGVVDQPYSGPGGESTGDVAGYLESKYHVMEHFYELNQEFVAEALAESVEGALETLMMGGPAGDPYGTAGGKIDQRFREMLSGQELDRLGYPGIPTMAAQEGVSHRFKRRRNKGRGGRSPGTPRPSFIDTGLYESSFKSWVD